MNDWKNKIKRKSLGEAPTEASENLQAPEVAPVVPVTTISTISPKTKTKKEEEPKINSKELSRIEELERELNLLRDKRLTGRTEQLGLKVKPSFRQELKKLALEEGIYIVEILEKALEYYKQKKKEHE